MTRRPARVLGWIALLGAAIAALRLAATGQLAAPPLTSLDALEAWVEVRGPIPTAMAIVRLVSELATWYLLGLSTLHVVARAARFEAGHAVADALASPAVRRLVHGALGLSLVAAGTAGEGSAGELTPLADVVTDLDSREIAREQVSAGTATMRPLDTPRPTGTATMRPVPGTPTWSVQAGESFWTIAAEVLEDAWGRHPTDREIDPFWRALVDANRDRLVDPADPDLILPGQVFEVPPVPPGG